MELGYFLADCPLILAAVVTLGAIGAAGAALSVAVVGVVVLAGGLRAARGLGRWQRALAELALGEVIAEPEPFAARPGLTGWLRAALGDRAGWKSVLYFAAKVPLSAFGVWFALSVWLEALLSLLSPVIGDGRGSHGYGVVPNLFGPAYPGGAPVGPATHAGVLVSGVALLLLAPWPMRLVVNFDRRMMHVLLGPDAAASRVRRLEESRARTVDAATARLRRIERDLHDGTQAQLVALAMRLGQAKEKLDGLAAPDPRTGPAGAPGADLEAVRCLVEEAHRGAKEAIADLRDLARGIHPPALDTGLENAVGTGLPAARCPPRSRSPSRAGRPRRSRPSATSVPPSCWPTWPSTRRPPGRRSPAPSTGPGCGSSCATTGAAGRPSAAAGPRPAAWPAWRTGWRPSTVT